MLLLDIGPANFNSRHLLHSLSLWYTCYLRSFNFYSLPTFHWHIATSNVPHAFMGWNRKNKCICDVINYMGVCRYTQLGKFGCYLWPHRKMSLGVTGFFWRFITYLLTTQGVGVGEYTVSDFTSLCNSVLIYSHLIFGLCFIFLHFSWSIWWSIMCSVNCLVKLVMSLQNCSLCEKALLDHLGIAQVSYFNLICHHHVCYHYSQTIGDIIVGPPLNSSLYL